MMILTTHLRLKMKLHKAIPGITQEYQHPFIITDILHILLQH